MFSFDRRI